MKIRKVAHIPIEIRNMRDFLRLGRILGYYEYALEQGRQAMLSESLSQDASG